MKVVRIVGIIFVICIVGLFLTVPGFEKLSLCLEKASKGLDINIKAAKAEKWSREMVCMNGKSIVENMQVCYKNAESQAHIPVSLIESLAKIVKPNLYTLSKSLDAHNNACISYPQSQVKPQ